MKLSTIKKITKSKKKVYDITVENNHNFFCNGHLIHNCDYRNDVGVLLYNNSDVPWKPSADKPIAQIIFEVFSYASLEQSSELPDTDRGLAGFGSTDEKSGRSHSKLLPAEHTSTILDVYTKNGAIPIKKKYSDEVRERESI